MASTREQIVDICGRLSELEEHQATFNVTARGFLFAGVGGAVGTMLAGPLGSFIGGIAGSAIATYLYWGRSRSVADVIKNDMTPDQQRRLIDSANGAVVNLKREDASLLIFKIITSDEHKAAALGEIVRFVTNEMGMTITKR